MNRLGRNRLGREQDLHGGRRLMVVALGRPRVGADCRRSRRRGRGDAVGDRAMAQDDAELLLHPRVDEPARLAEEAHLQRREPRRRLGAAEARRARQAEAVGDEVEVVAHLQLAVVGDVDRALRPAAMQRGNAGAREIVGMDVAGVDVVGHGEHRRAARDALARIAAGRSSA